VDTLCLGRVNGIDGVNASADAPKHTIGCMLAPLCVASGFNLLEQVGDEYVVRYQLDAAGNALAESKLRELHAASIINNVQFTVRGTPGYTATEIYNGMTLGRAMSDVAMFSAGTPGATLEYPLQVQAGSDEGGPVATDTTTTVSRSTADSESGEDGDGDAISQAELYLVMVVCVLVCALLALGWDWHHSQKQARSTALFRMPALAVPDQPVPNTATDLQPVHTAVPDRAAPHTAISLAPYAPLTPAAPTQQPGRVAAAVRSWGSVHYNVPGDPAALADGMTLPSTQAGNHHPASPSTSSTNAVPTVRSSATVTAASDAGGVISPQAIIM